MLPLGGGMIPRYNTCHFNSVKYPLVKSLKKLRGEEIGYLVIFMNNEKRYFYPCDFLKMSRSLEAFASATPEQLINIRMLGGNDGVEWTRLDIQLEAEDLYFETRRKRKIYHIIDK